MKSDRNQASRQALRHRYANRCLHIEPLETRQLLAVLTVGGSGTFATVQEAVDNARPGDELELADGTYAESVDLSRMGTAVGSRVGNLTIRGAGQAAVIAPAGGSAVFNSAPFNGQLTLQRLTLEARTATAADERGLNLDGFNGDLTVSGVTVQSIESGIDIVNASGTMLLKEVEVFDTGSGAGDHGVLLDQISGRFQIFDSTIRDVADIGIVVGNRGDREMALIIEDSTVAGDPSNHTTTNRGLRLTVEDTSRTDLILRNVSFDDMDEAGFELFTNDSAEVQLRATENVFFNTNQAESILLETRDGSRVAAQFDVNTISDSRANAMRVALLDTSSMNLVLDDNLFFNIGDGADDNGLVITSDDSADAVFNGYARLNDFVTITGTGVLLEGRGDTQFNFSFIDNALGDINSSNGLAALDFNKPSAASAAQFNLDVRMNSVSDTSQGAYRFAQQGTGLFRLEGTEANARAQIVATNEPMDDTKVSTSGSITIVPEGSFDSTQPLRIGDFVWHDLDGNGVQDDGEPGVALVEVGLTGTETTGGASVDRTTFSDSTGAYIVPALLPGDYTVTLRSPGGLSLTEPTQGNDTALDSDFVRATRSVDVTLQPTLENDTVDGGFVTNWQNGADPLDVNGDTVRAPVDALVIINDLNARGSRPLPLPGSGTAPFLDVSGDDIVAPGDVLQVINALNASSGSGEGEAGEGEGSVPALLPPLFAAATGASPSPVGLPNSPTSDPTTIAQLGPHAADELHRIQWAAAAVDAVFDIVADDDATDTDNDWTDLLEPLSHRAD